MHTEHEVRSTQAKAGGLGLAATAGSALLAGTSTWPLLDSLALAGAAAGSVATAAAAAHHRFYFEPRRRFRRELGGPTGWLDAQDLAAAASAEAVRKHAAGTWADRDPWRHPVNVSGWEAGRLVSGPRHLRRRPVYSPWARGIGILGPQGSGKTQYLIRLLLDAPGAVVAPSTKPELAEATMALRARQGPVYVFNPTGLGTLANTFSWDPISGCADQAVADRRAWALVRGGGAASGTDRAQFWAQKAQEIIRCYL
ncbi:type IV secretory system conjugative DNA transfer family protein, partial [Pseudonocardia sp. KRD291]|uniref:type IV secretory system conjugative DNA transfer family protein n=1 Tax=Pseudonocardia sp. KRD291 TaxID=2792007 RepID=UPI001C4A3F8F